MVDLYDVYRHNSIFRFTVIIYVNKVALFILRCLVLLHQINATLCGVTYFGEMAFIFTSITSSFSGRTQPAVLQGKWVTTELPGLVLTLALIGTVWASSATVVSLVPELLYRRSRFLFDPNRTGVYRRRVVIG